MTGLFLLLCVALALLAGLWLFGVRGPWWTMTAAALAFGAAGYAVEGRPGLEGSPHAAAGARQAPLPLTGARYAFFGRFDRTDQWATISEAFAARGNTEDAVKILQSAVRDHPRNFALWTLLGNALVDHHGGLNPAARLAFARAEALAPNQPGPRFFRALAQARSGETDEAVAAWQSILDEAPADAGWRPLVEQGIIAMGGGAGTTAPQATAP